MCECRVTPGRIKRFKSHAYVMDQEFVAQVKDTNSFHFVSGLLFIQCYSDSVSMPRPSSPVQTGCSSIAQLTSSLSE